MKPVAIQTLHARLKDAGFREIRLADNAYVTPSREWLGDFGRWLRRQAPEYFAEKFDCENFARWASCEADKALYATDETGAGHTFAEATCVIAGPDRQPLAHALNVCLCDDDALYVLEPQTGDVCALADFAAVWLTVRL